MPKEITSVQNHPISFTEDFRPNDEYNIASYVFTDSKGKESDGCVFEISPRGSTRVMKITDEKLTCQRIVVEGSGWFLGVSPENEVVCFELNSNNEENPLIELSQGWVDCFIAGEEGMKVADVSTPQFNPQMEINIPKDDPALPQIFWNTYKDLKQID